MLTNFTITREELPEAMRGEITETVEDPLQDVAFVIQGISADALAQVRAFVTDPSIWVKSPVALLATFEDIASR